MATAAQIAGTVIAFALGIYAAYMTQIKIVGSDPTAPKMQKLCMAGDMTALKEAGFHEYESEMGGGFICIVTQFVLALVKEPAGILVWGAAGIHLFPLMLLVYTEAGRPGAKSFVNWPILTFLLGQVFGISFAFPCFWVSSALRQGTGGGSPASGRVWTAMLVPLLVTLLEAAVFNLDTNTRAWTICADSLVGPGLAFVGILTWPFPAPRSLFRLPSSCWPMPVPPYKSSDARKQAYSIMAAISAAGYYYLIYCAWRSFDSSEELLAAIWGPKASPWVAFMTVDSSVLSLSMLVYLAASCRGLDVLIAVLFSPFIGPASAYCFVLRSREQQRLESLNRIFRLKAESVPMLVAVGPGSCLDNFGREFDAFFLHCGASLESCKTCFKELPPTAGVVGLEWHAAELWSRRCRVLAEDGADPRQEYTPRTRAIRLSLLLPFLTTDYVSPCQDIWTCNASLTGQLGRGAISSSREKSDSACWRLPFPVLLPLASFGYHVRDSLQLMPVLPRRSSWNDTLALKGRVQAAMLCNLIAGCLGFTCRAPDWWTCHLRMDRMGRLYHRETKLDPFPEHAALHIARGSRRGDKAYLKWLPPPSLSFPRPEYQQLYLFVYHKGMSTLFRSLFAEVLAFLGLSVTQYQWPSMPRRCGEADFTGLYVQPKDLEVLEQRCPKYRAVQILRSPLEMLSSGYAYHAYQSDAPPGSGPKVLQNLSVAEGLKLEAKLHLRRKHGFHRGNTIADMWAVYRNLKDDPRVLTLRAEDIFGSFDDHVRRMLSHLLPSLRMGPGLWRQIRGLAARFDESRCGRCIPTPSAQTTESQRRLKRRARRELATEALRRTGEVRKILRLQRELGYEEEEEEGEVMTESRKRELLRCCRATARPYVSETWSLKFKDSAELRSVLLQRASSCVRHFGHVVFVDWGLDGLPRTPSASSSSFLASLLESPLLGACISSHLRCGVIERVWSQTPAAAMPAVPPPPTARLRGRICGPEDLAHVLDSLPADRTLQETLSALVQRLESEAGKTKIMNTGSPLAFRCPGTGLLLGLQDLLDEEKTGSAFCSVGADFSKLEEVLKEKDFKAADAETRRLLIELGGEAAVKRGWVYFAEVRKIEEQDMDAMETLWQHYSEGRFGFSPQRKIWKRVRGQFDKFAEEVSWFTDTWKNRNWPGFGPCDVRPDEFIYSLEAPARLSESQLVTAGEAKLELSASAEELLSHPAIENRKAAAVKARPSPSSEPTDDSGKGFEAGGLPKFGRPKFVKPPAFKCIGEDTTRFVRPAPAARSPRLHSLRGAQPARRRAAAKSPFDQVPKAVSLDPLLNDQLSSMGQEISHLLLRAGPAKDFEEMVPDTVMAAESPDLRIVIIPDRWRCDSLPVSNCHALDSRHRQCQRSPMQLQRCSPRCAAGASDASLGGTPRHGFEAERAGRCPVLNLQIQEPSGSFNEGSVVFQERFGGITVPAPLAGKLIQSTQQPRSVSSACSWFRASWPRGVSRRVRAQRGRLCAPERPPPARCAAETEEQALLAIAPQPKSGGPMKKWFWRPFKRTSFKHHGYYGQSTPPCIDTERDMVFNVFSFIAKLPAQ
ncbi:GUN4 [Symbiodinium microadriaticum]|nr:GUN4 [Symbiodinium microadriaticum]